jgi:transcriptional regulator with XRE-family HTH domain
MINPRQIRAARGLLDWSTADLAERVGLARDSIKRIEDGATTPREGTLSDIAAAFTDAGVEFIDNNGVRLRPTNITTFEGAEGFTKFFDFVFGHLSIAGGDVCICGSSSRTFSEYRRQPELHRERMTSLVKSRANISVRILAEEGDPNMPARTYATYRWLPKEYFSPTTFYAFGEYFALISFAHDPAPIVVCIHSKNMADDYRKSFSALWDRTAKSAPIGETK